MEMLHGALAHPEHEKFFSSGNEKSADFWTSLETTETTKTT